MSGLNCVCFALQKLKIGSPVAKSDQKKEQKCRKLI